MPEPLQARPRPPGDPPAAPAARVCCIRFGRKLFDRDKSVIRYADGLAQRIFAEIHSMLSSAAYAKGTLCLVGHAAEGKEKPYRANLGQRRAEAVKAALCGDAARAKAIMERLLQIEMTSRFANRWDAEDAGHLLALPYPDTPFEERIKTLQAECHMKPDGIANPATYVEIIEAYANAVSCAEWVVPRRIYSAMTVETKAPGVVEAWIFPTPTPPNGSQRSWKRRLDPVVMTPENDVDAATD